MQIIINIRKQHLYLMSLVAGILLGIIAVNAYRDPPNTTIRASTLGHSVDEINWNREIPATVSIRDNMTVGGRAGIGTNNPAEKLDVNGDIKTRGAILHHATGSSPSCSIGGMVIRKWNARTCEGDRFSPCSPPAGKPTSCTTSSSWSIDPRTCNYYQFDEFAPGQCATFTCSTNTWSEAFCVGN